MFLKPLVTWDLESAAAHLRAVETRPTLILVLTLPVSEGLFFLLKVFVSGLKKMVKSLSGLPGENFCELEMN